MSLLKLDILGPARLTSPDGRVLLTSPLPMALLAFLALEDRPVSRVHLAQLFWPGGDQSRRLHNLRQTILRLKSAHTQGVIVGDVMLQIRPMTLETDVDAFKQALAEGRIGDGVALWRGAFLEGFRRPQSWELEDWIDRQRSLLEAALVHGVTKGARHSLDGNAPDAALDLLRPSRNLLPEDENLAVLEVRALAAKGRRAEAEGLLSTLDFLENPTLESEARAALAASPDPVVAEPQPVPEREEDSESLAPTLPEPLPALRSWSGMRRTFLWLSAALVLLSLSVAGLRWHGAGAAISRSDAAGYRVLLCTSWASSGRALQLFRMRFDGTEKDRISSEHLCEGAWIDEVQAIFGAVPHLDPKARLVRLDPNPSNPIGEWTLSEVESARDLRATRIMRTSSKVGPGGLLVFSAEDSGGNRDIYALDPVQDQVRRLTDSPERDDWPTVAPDGDRVIFTSFRTGGGDLYSVGLDGRGLERLTDNPLQDGAPWVRGDSVIFVRGLGTANEDGNMELFLLNLSTGEETQLTDNAWNDYEQMWSADGRYLCWQAERLGHFESDIMMMDLVTKRSWNATGTLGRESDCRLTPVGNGLLYLRHEDPEGTEVFYQDRRGADPVNLSRYPGSESIVGFFLLPEGMR